MMNPDNVTYVFDHLIKILTERHRMDTDSTSKERLIMGLIYIHQKVRKRKKLPLTPLIKAREEHKKF